MKKIFNYLTTFKIGKVTPLAVTVILCMLCVNALMWQDVAVQAAANANVPDHYSINLNNSPYMQYSEGYWSGTTFAGESAISIVIYESRDVMEWDRIIWDYQTSTVGTWAGGGAYDYRDLIYTDARGLKDTFYGSITSSVVGGEWWVHAYDVDGE